MNSALRPPSRPLLTAFTLYLRWYTRRHFHAFRVAHCARFPIYSGQAAQRTIVALNHPSWWDPLTCILLSQHLLPHANHYAPMDAAELARYRFFARLGLFPVEQESARGAAQFLRAGLTILSSPNSVLWVTPQGAFADVRERPPLLRPGLASLISRAHGVTVVPLALEYVFWNERLPEILANWGEPLLFEKDSQNQSEVNRILCTGLARTQDELATAARSRSAEAFATILSGRAGIGGIYDLWLRGHSRSGRSNRHNASGSMHAR